MKAMKGVVLSMLVLLAAVSFAQSDSKKQKIAEDSKAAKAEFIKTDSLMASLFNSAQGYAIFPNVGKAAVGVGGLPVMERSSRMVH